MALPFWTLNLINKFLGLLVERLDPLLNISGLNTDRVELGWESVFGLEFLVAIYFFFE
jgi:hypothetical protein